jgi:nucleotide-binding universal stress UspA family protein
MPYRTVIVGTDGSITAGRAVERAAELARASGARLVVVFVGEPAAGKAVLDGVERQYGDAETELDLRLAEGDPADALLGVAEAEAGDLVVVGNKGMSGAQRFLLGSVPNKVSHQAKCDVLIVATSG